MGPAIEVHLAEIALGEHQRHCGSGLSVPTDPTDRRARQRMFALELHHDAAHLTMLGDPGELVCPPRLTGPLPAVQQPRADQELCVDGDDPRQVGSRRQLERGPGAGAESDDGDGRTPRRDQVVDGVADVSSRGRVVEVRPGRAAPPGAGAEPSQLEAERHATAGRLAAGQIDEQATRADRGDPDVRCARVGRADGLAHDAGEPRRTAAMGAAETHVGLADRHAVVVELVGPQRRHVRPERRTLGQLDVTEDRFGIDLSGQRLDPTPHFHDVAVGAGELVGGGEEPVLGLGRGERRGRHLGQQAMAGIELGQPLGAVDDADPAGRLSAELAGVERLEVVDKIRRHVESGDGDAGEGLTGRLGRRRLHDLELANVSPPREHRRPHDHEVDRFVDGRVGGDERTQPNSEHHDVLQPGVTHVVDGGADLVVPPLAGPGAVEAAGTLRRPGEVDHQGRDTVRRQLLRERHEPDGHRLLFVDDARDYEDTGGRDGAVRPEPARARGTVAGRQPEVVDRARRTHAASALLSIRHADPRTSLVEPQPSTDPRCPPEQ